MILLDTGVLIGLLSENDDHHTKCLAWFSSVDRSRLLIPTTIITETCYMVSRLKGSQSESVFLQDLSQGAYGESVEITSADLYRMSQLVETYGDLPLGAADASLVAIGERLNITEIATVDHRHFTVVRPTHIRGFALTP